MAWDMLDVSALRRIDLFDDVDDEVLTKLIDITTTGHYEPGEIIFDEDDPGEALYFILDGSVRISRELHGAGKEILALLTSGAYFGEMALLEPQATRSARASAESDAHVGSLRRSDFMELVETNPDVVSEILWSFIATLCARIRQTNDRVTFFALSSRFG